MLTLATSRMPTRCIFETKAQRFSDIALYGGAGGLDIKRSDPPARLSGSRPNTTLASVTVGRSPPMA